MAQTQILAAGTTAATSTDVTVAAGAEANLIAFTAAGNSMWANDAYLTVYIDTNGEDQAIARLTFAQPGVTVQGPGTFRIRRTPQLVALGATSET